IAALLVRSFLGGGAEPVKAQPAAVASVGVLVAADSIEPGRSITQQMVKWQPWPKDSVDSTFITSDANPSVDQIVAGTVARAPIVAGEPLTNTKIVHADAAGFMSARLTPGMRAVSIGISTESGAGGFILPNDRVDVMLSLQVSDSPRRFAANTLLHDVRVLAVDQTYKEDKDQKTGLATHHARTRQGRPGAARRRCAGRSGLKSGDCRCGRPLAAPHLSPRPEDGADQCLLLRWRRAPDHVHGYPGRARRDRSGLDDSRELSWLEYSCLRDERQCRSQRQSWQRPGSNPRTGSRRKLCRRPEEGRQHDQ